MPRARNIKPAFFKNELLVELPIEARLLFIGLWTLADREGRLENRPKRIKMEIYPCDNFDIEELLKSLHDKGFIQIYGEYIQIVNFTKHQSPHVKEAASIIPAPDQHSASMVQTPDQHPLNPESLILKPETPILKPEAVATATKRIDVMTLYTALDGQQVVSPFDAFWQDYPTMDRSKGSKKDAEAKFKLALKKVSFNEIMEGLRKYTEYIRHTGQKNQDAFRWLEKERWADDYTIQQQNIGNKNGNNNKSILSIADTLARL